MSVTLSPQQEEAMKLLLYWYRNSDEKIFTLAGYAGTGKSTLASLLHEHIKGDVHYCALTGKAAHVLRQKGVIATTIHSVLYTSKEKGQKRLRELQAAALAEKDKDRHTELLRLIALEKRQVSKPSFQLNPETVLRDNDLVVIDEYSMLDLQLVEDLKSVCKKILCLGDPGQLPPVAGTSPLVPDFFLTEVHRQALDSPILRNATRVRNGYDVEPGDSGAFKCLPSADVGWDHYQRADQLIVARNKTRSAFNKRFREKLERAHSALPIIGDRLICLKNNHDLGLFNGDINVTNANAEVLDENTVGIEFNGMALTPAWVGRFFDAEPDPWMTRELEQFDYAYAITCHKSQGSEFKRVIVWDEGFGRTAEDLRRWRYTAISRAVEQCILVKP